MVAAGAQSTQLTGVGSQLQATCTWEVNTGAHREIKEDVEFTGILFIIL